jgi:hypothetical protein
MRKPRLSTSLEVVALCLGAFILVYVLPDSERAEPRAGGKVFAAPRNAAAASPGAAGSAEIAARFHELLVGVATGNIGEERRSEIHHGLIALLDAQGVGDTATRTRAAGLLVQQLFDQSKQQRTSQSLSLRQQQAIGALAKELARQLLAFAAPGGGAVKGADSILAPLPDGYERASWKLLGGFPYHEAVALPADVTALDGKSIGMPGFMLTLGDTDDIREFILVESLWGCCFGTVPDLNQSILVRVKDGARADYTAAPVLVTGVLEVGEQREGGYVASLYRIEGASVRLID